MPTIEISQESLLDAIKRMPPDEFDSFIERALIQRRAERSNILSANESTLISRINQGLTSELVKRSAQLIRRRDKGTLTTAEHQELVKLTEEAEFRDADRAEALLELAKLRGVPLKKLMRQMGIKARRQHG